MKGKARDPDGNPYGISDPRVRKPAIPELGRVLEKHFDKHPVWSWDDVAQLFAIEVMNAFPRYWGVAEQRRNLEKVRTALRNLETSVKAIDQQVQFEMEILTWELASEQIRQRFDETGGQERLELEDLRLSKAFRSMMTAAHLWRELEPLFEAMPERIEQGEPVGKKALVGWRVIHAADLIRIHLRSDMSVPNSMGDSGPFYRLLKDLFDVFGLEESPVELFKSWRKYVRRAERK